MKIAYLILAHKAPTQLKRLVNSLGEDDIYVHIDEKQNIGDFYIDKKNITYINERVDIKWGGFSMIQATINLIEHAKDKYDFYILLSGDDYLINSLKNFKEFLDCNRNNSFLEYKIIESKCKYLTKRYEKFWIKEERIWFISLIEKIIYCLGIKRKMYNSFIPYKGSQWWCLNNEAITYTMNYIKDNPRVIKYFKHTHIPDEMFFQTILLNSKLSKTIVNNNLRYIILEDFHPEILTYSDYDELVNCKDKFLARKFDINVDNKILDMLDEYNNL